MHCNINVYRIRYLCIAYFVYAVSKWIVVSNYYFFSILLGLAAVLVFETVIVPLTSSFD